MWRLVAYVVAKYIYYFALPTSFLILFYVVESLRDKFDANPRYQGMIILLFCFLHIVCYALRKLE